MRTLFAVLAVLTVWITPAYAADVADADGIQNYPFVMGWKGDTIITAQEMVDDAFGEQRVCTLADVQNTLEIWNSEIDEGPKTRNRVLWLREATAWLQNAVTERMKLHENQ